MRVIIVSGALANKPFNGGEAWVRLSWARGLRRLGFHVYFVEQISPGNCTDAAGAPSDVAHSANLEYFQSVAREFGLADSAVLIDVETGTRHGSGASALMDAAASAELLVNISGHLTYEPVKGCIRKRVYIDIDPGFTQFWHADGNPGAHMKGHDLYFTIGENIGSPGCEIPTGGIPWRITRQPVVLDDWPVCSQGNPCRFTTIASWRGAYGPVQAGGKTYGVKAHEFRKFVELPTRLNGSGQIFEIALDIHAADDKDRRLLIEHGWRIVAPRDVAAGPNAFRRYVQESGGEFSAAQGIYVQTRSGWFSDRTIRYLASGKPALVQDTGFPRHLPTGEGLLAFSTVEEAADAARRIGADYRAHSQAARALAESHFNSDIVLGQFLEAAGVRP